MEGQPVSAGVLSVTDQVKISPYDSEHEGREGGHILHIHSVHRATSCLRRWPVQPGLSPSAAGGSTMVCDNITFCTYTSPS